MKQSVTNAPNIILLVPIFNVEDIIDEWVKYIEQLETKPSKIIFCENNSSDGTLEKLWNLKIKDAEIEVIRFYTVDMKDKKLLPFSKCYDVIAHARQLLLTRARKLNPDYAIFVDSDVYLMDPTTLESLTIWDKDIIGGMYRRCVDEETEALTLNGWKNYKDLGLSDKILILKDNVLQYEELEGLYFEDYDGKMISAKGKQSTDMLLTPDHRVYYRYLLNRKKNKNYKFKWRIKLAKDLKPWNVIRIGGSNIYGRERVNKYFAELCGWVLTDGHFYRGKGSDEGYGISIYQTLEAHPEKVRRIKFLLEKLNIKYNIRKRYRHGRTEFEFYLNSGFLDKRNKLVMNIRDLFKNKKGNYSILEAWDRESLSSLLNGIILGDGCKDRTEIRIACDEEKADFYQALIIRLGYSSVKSKHDGLSKNSYVVSVNKKLVKGLQRAEIKEVNYRGKIWCPTVSSGLWLARRKGKIFITGNCFPTGVFIATLFYKSEILKEKHKEWLKLRQFPMGVPLKEVHATSGGLLCLSRKAIQDKRLNFYPVPEGYSEDFGYCDTAHKLGYTVWVDGTINVGHKISLKWRAWDVIREADDERAKAFDEGTLIDDLKKEREEKIKTLKSKDKELERLREKKRIEYGKA